MRKRAHAEGRDLVVVDTGDLVTGHGFSDSTKPRGKLSNQFVARADYDILTIGNHELYEEDALQELRKRFVPRWGGRYLTSNVDMNVSGKSEPIGQRWHSYVLPKTGLRVTALGIMFPFVSPIKSVVVTPPSRMIKEPWFVELLTSDLAVSTDLWLLAGHMPLANDPEDEWDSVIQEIRSYVGPSKTIVALGGHTHVRNCRKYDERTMLLQSGRFHETSGWLSVQWPHTNGTIDADSLPKLARRYIDLNPRNMAYHLGYPTMSPSLFADAEALGIRALLRLFWQKSQLNEVLAFAPQDYYLERYPAHHGQSIINGTHEILTLLFAHDDQHNNTASLDDQQDRLVILNSGSLRADIRRGPFVLNDLYVISPFSDYFYVLSDVPPELAILLQDKLNAGTKERQALPLSNLSTSYREDFPPHINQTLGGQNASVGYVTIDQCGPDGTLAGDGDDTLHSPIPIVPFEPPYIFTTIPGAETPKSNGDRWKQTGSDPVFATKSSMQIITVEHLLPRIVDTLNSLAAGDNFHAVSDTGVTAAIHRPGPRWEITRAKPYTHRQKLASEMYAVSYVSARSLWPFYARCQWNRAPSSKRTDTRNCFVDQTVCGRKYAPARCTRPLPASHWRAEWDKLQQEAQRRGFHPR